MSASEIKLPSSLLNLKYLISNDCFIVCQPIASDGFIEFCKKRNIATSRAQLERYEKLGLFYPIARVKYFYFKTKVEKEDAGYRELEVLQEGEEWTGETEKTRSHFSFERELAEEYLAEEMLWQPDSRRFQPWDKFRDSAGNDLIESYYSPFQCHTLYLLNQWLTHTLGLHWWASYRNPTLQKKIKEISRFAKDEIARLKKHGVWAKQAPLVCQVIANRYFPKTQSDRRTVTVSMASPYHRSWDWFTYARAWDAHKIIADVGITPEQLKSLQERVSRDAQSADPIEHWYDLVEFVSLEKKKQLKDNALLAQTFYAMEKMLRLFYEDLTAEVLPRPDENYRWRRSSYYGDEVAANDLKYIEFIVNRYHLNPRPRLILFVEGHGEFEQFPRLARDVFGSEFSKSRIQVQNLEGVAKFTGDEKTEKYGALARFIDAFHSMQTIVFVVLDREGNTERVKQRLIGRPSQYYPRRTITKDDYVYIWDRTIEFDNFTNTEIAKAMTEVSGRRHVFKANEIEDCKKLFDRNKGDRLSELFSAKCNYGLSKPKLLEILIGYLLANPKAEFDENGFGKRPIVRLTRRILELAGRNHQPISLALWTRNQESGYFGQVLK